MWCSQVARFPSGRNGHQKHIIQQLSKYKCQNCTGCNVHNFQVVAIVADHLHLRRHRDRNVTSPRAKDHWCLYFVPLSVTNIIIIIITKITIIIITIMWGKIWECNIEFRMLVAWNLIATDDPSFCSSFLSSIGHCIVWIHSSMVPSKTRWQKVNILRAQEII